MDTTERLHFHFSLSCIGEGNGNALQCSCLENPRDGGAWWAAVYGVGQSRTRLKRLSSSSSKVIKCCHWFSAFYRAPFYGASFKSYAFSVLCCSIFLTVRSWIWSPVAKEDMVSLINTIKALWCSYKAYYFFLFRAFNGANICHQLHHPYWKRK